MTTDTQQFIKGYRKLSPSEVAMINEIKDLGEFINDKLKQLERLDYIDKRWLAIGTTEMQKGIMSITRSIAKPEGF